MSTNPHTRSPTAGPADGPIPPFPIRLSGPIIKGFGRGSKELGIPTANIPITGLSIGGHDDVESGIYYGWAGADIDEQGRRLGDGGSAEAPSRDAARGGVWPMVMSIGWNPFYKNTVRSVEVHILPPNPFIHDFYGAHLNLMILGHIRPERDYDSTEALVRDIKIDIEVAKASSAREAYRGFREEDWLLEFPPTMTAMTTTTEGEGEKR